MARICTAHREAPTRAHAREESQELKIEFDDTTYQPLGLGPT